MNSFKVLTLPLFGKNDFAGYRIIGLQIFFSPTLSRCCSIFWRALIGSVKKPVAILIPVYKIITHLMMGISSEKCIVRRFCYCVNIIKYTNLHGVAYYPPRLCAIPLLNIQFIVDQHIID